MTTHSSDTSTSALTERIRTLRDQLLTGLVERDDAIRLALLATLAGEHLLLVGPPGTAKSLIARRLRLAFAGATYFERLLTRFSVPEELFGPLSIQGLEHDRYERLTDSYLPTASVAFLDEIFKANSAILNSLLTLLNERSFDNGTTRVKTPLIAVVGASNELPEGADLAALFDRFLLRLHVGPVSQSGFTDLLGLRGEADPDITEDMRLTARELERVRENAVLIDVPADVISLLSALRNWCAVEGLPVSDRRWRKVVKLLQVSALTNGRSEVSIWDCWLLQHCLWNEPTDREKVFQWYAERVGASTAMDPARLTRMVTVYEAELTKDRSRRSQRQDDNGRPLFTDPDGKVCLQQQGRRQKMRGDDLLYLAPEGAQDHTGYRATAVSRDMEGNGYTLAELAKLHVERNNYRFNDWPNKSAYLADQNNWLMEENVHPPLMEPTRHARPYVESSLATLAEAQAQVDTYIANLEAHMSSLDDKITHHLWVLSNFARPALASLTETRNTVAALQRRLALLVEGYEMLPVAEPVSLPSLG